MQQFFTRLYAILLYRLTTIFIINKLYISPAFSPGGHKSHQCPLIASTPGLRNIRPYLCKFAA